MELQPASVPLAKQVGDIRSRWEWVEPSVWTDPMLAALEKGVQGGKWFSLIDKVWLPGNLSAALRKVVKNKGAAGVDHISVPVFFSRSGPNLKQLAEQLRRGTYRPQAIRRVYIPKPGSTEKRPLGIPTVRDRVVQAALVHVLEPIFERDFAPTSFGFRPGRGAQQALDRVEELLKAGYSYVVDADLRKYFDTIPHDRLMQRIGEKVSDGRVLSLVESFLKAGIMEGAEEWTPSSGAPQGAVLSPLLSNIYLNPLDHVLRDSNLEVVRYADDFVILCRSLDEAKEALKLVQAWVEENGLQLHPEKTRIVDSRTESFEFLGIRFENRLKLVREKSLEKLKETVREKTRRNSGQSLEETIGKLNRTLRGWFEYFKRCQGNIYERLDEWIRRRLRSMLRKQHKLKGISKHGVDHQRWPNAWFEGQGLFSLKAARAAYRANPP